MKKLWLTYAWKDNEANDIDFVAQRLQDQGIEVQMDKNQLQAGRRLWDQIDNKISWSGIDAWAIFVSENSLRSEPCQEELAYALDRVLRTNRNGFPIIGIFPTPLDREIIPSAIATRLWVHLKDENWSNQIADSLFDKNTHQPKFVDSTEITTHYINSYVVIEMRPREGNWYPAGVAVPAAEFDELFVTAFKGPRNSPKISTPMVEQSEINGEASNGLKTKGWQVHEQVDSTCSLYAVFRRMPSIILCGGKRLKAFYPPESSKPVVGP